MAKQAKDVLSVDGLSTVQKLKFFLLIWFGHEGLAR
jgi:hypothetical protein